MMSSPHMHKLLVTTKQKDVHKKRDEITNKYASCTYSLLTIRYYSTLSLQLLASSSNSFASDLVGGPRTVRQEQEIRARRVGQEIEKPKDAGGRVGSSTLSGGIRPSGQLDNEADEVQQR